MKKILIAIVALSIISFIGCKPGGGGDPKSILVQFFTALSKNDIEGARKLATKDSKSMIDMMEMGMKMGKDKEANKFEISKMEFSEAKIDGDKAVVPVKELTSGETLNYTLKKEDGSWKVAFDKSSMMEMGMDKAREKGINPTKEGMDSLGAAMEKLKNINLDSMKDGMNKGMEALDSAKKELEKMKNQ